MYIVTAVQWSNILPPPPVPQPRSGHAALVHNHQVRSKGCGTMHNSAEWTVDHSIVESTRYALCYVCPTVHTGMTRGTGVDQWRL
jgi:hypothetical protein